MARMIGLLPRCRLSALSIILVSIIGLAAPHTLPEGHETDTKEGIYAPLVFPKDDWKYGGPGFLTPPHANHLDPKNLSKVTENEKKPSDVPDPPVKPAEISATNNTTKTTDSNNTKSSNISEKNDTTSGNIMQEVVTSTSENNLKTQSTTIASSNITNVEKMDAKNVAVKQLMEVNTENNKTVEGVEKITADIVTQSSAGTTTEFKKSIADEHWKHDHISGKGGPVPFAQSPEVAILMAAIFVTVALIGYFGLVCWRRALEEKYGNRELLMNEEDMNDYKSYEL